MSKPTALCCLSAVAVLVSGCAVGLRGRSEHFTPATVHPDGVDHPVLDISGNPTTALVQLRCRRSFAARRVAVHPWFLVYNPEKSRWDKWHVWGFGGASFERNEFEEPVYSSAGTVAGSSTMAIEWHGYVGKQEGLRARPNYGTVLAEWHGEVARRIIEVLERPTDYPHHNHYRIWPGPNSNTYAAWVLREARVPIDLHPMAVGKDYRGPLGFGLGFSNSRTGLQIETPALGTKVGLTDGVELHFITLTFGVDLLPPALKLPFGRFGFAE